MTPGLAEAMEGVVVALSLGYGGGLAFVALILFVRRPGGR